MYRFCNQPQARHLAGPVSSKKAIGPIPLGHPGPAGKQKSGVSHHVVAVIKKRSSFPKKRVRLALGNLPRTPLVVNSIRSFRTPIRNLPLNVVLKKEDAESSSA